MQRPEMKRIYHHALKPLLWGSICKSVCFTLMFSECNYIRKITAMQCFLIVI